MADNGIDLRVEPYCAFCPYFEPDMEKIDITVAMDTTKKTLTTIRCERSNICEQVSARIKEVEHD